jgi:hypothetical protein
LPQWIEDRGNHFLDKHRITDARALDSQFCHHEDDTKARHHLLQLGSITCCPSQLDFDKPPVQVTRHFHYEQRQLIERVREILETDEEVDQDYLLLTQESVDPLLGASVESEMNCLFLQSKVDSMESAEEIIPSEDKTYCLAIIQIMHGYISEFVNAKYLRQSDFFVTNDASKILASYEMAAQKMVEWRESWRAQSLQGIELPQEKFDELLPYDNIAELKMYNIPFERNALPLTSSCRGHSS